MHMVCYTSDSFMTRPYFHRFPSSFYNYKLARGNPSIMQDTLFHKNITHNGLVGICQLQAIEITIEMKRLADYKFRLIKFCLKQLNQTMQIAELYIFLYWGNSCHLINDKIAETNTESINPHPHFSHSFTEQFIRSWDKSN